LLLQEGIKTSIIASHETWVAAGKPPHELYYDTTKTFNYVNRPPSKTSGETASGCMTASGNASGGISDTSDVEEAGDYTSINGDSGCPSEASMTSEVSLSHDGSTP
jgi:hypothetical protein